MIKGLVSHLGSLTSRKRTQSPEKQTQSPEKQTTPAPTASQPPPPPAPTTATTTCTTTGKAMLKECCVTGFRWGGTPEGKESTLSKYNAYVTGTNEEVAVLYVHDAFGWKFPNNRLMADHLAQEANVTVYLPDFFDGEILKWECIKDRSRIKELDFHGFATRNAREVREPEIFACAKELRSRYKRVIGVGFCYGGWANMRLAAKGNNLVDAISVGQPSMVTHDDVANLSVPTQILVPEHDEIFVEHMRAYVNHVIPTLGIAYEYIFFPGMTHGFITRGNDTEGAEGKAMIRAKNTLVNWCRQWGHPV